MNRTRSFLLVSLFALVATVAGASSVHAADPRAVLARAKEVSGGKRWDAVTSMHMVATITTGGISGRVESFEDTRRGRFIDRFELGPMKGANGFDGQKAWSQDSSGQSRVEEGGDAREGTADEAYRRCLGYWFPERWTATIEDGGEKAEGSRRFAIVRLTPKGGRPFDLWLDLATGFVDRSVEKAAIETRTTFFSDFRDVKGLKFAFAVRQTNGETKYDQLITLKAVALDEPVDDSRFAMPAPPPPDFSIAGGKTSTSMPFELYNNHIYVDVRLNGKGPFRLLCDTGGANIVTPDLAKSLGLATEGALQGRGVGEKSEHVGLTKISTVEVGDARLKDQVFMVFPLASHSDVEGVAEMGLIGYEVFKRFVVSIDYEHKQLTLTVPAAFAYKGAGAAVPFKFNEHIPQVDGTLDGIPGAFDLDTGSRVSLSLLAPFVDKHGLRAKYGAKIDAITGWGVGGPSRGSVVRVGVLTLGPVRIDKPVADLTLQQKGGFTDPYVAGNVGGGILKRFTVTFDYARQQVFFEPNASAKEADVYDRAGLWLNKAGDRFAVIDVVEGGPAAKAGLKVGDAVIAVDGQPAGKLLLPALRERFKTEAPGTEVRLEVESAGQKRQATLVLRDLV